MTERTEAEQREEVDAGSRCHYVTPSEAEFWDVAPEQLETVNRSIEKRVEAFAQIAVKTDPDFRISLMNGAIEGATCRAEAKAYFAAALAAAEEDEVSAVCHAGWTGKRAIWLSEVDDTMQGTHLIKERVADLKAGMKTSPVNADAIEHAVELVLRHKE